MAVAAGRDGKFYAAGFVAKGGDQAFAARPLRRQGRARHHLRHRGVATVNVAVGGKTAEIARGVAVQSDGKIVIAGPTEHAPGAAGNDGKDTDIAVARFDDNGKLDAAFGTQGVARIDLGTGKAVSDTTYVGDTSWGLGVLSDGRIVVFGSTPNRPPTAPTPTTPCWR